MVFEKAHPKEFSPGYRNKIVIHVRNLFIRVSKDLHFKPFQLMLSLALCDLLYVLLRFKKFNFLVVDLEILLHIKEAWLVLGKPELTSSRVLSLPVLTSTIREIHLRY